MTTGNRPLINLIIKKRMIPKGYKPFYDAKKPFMAYNDLNDVYIPTNTEIQQYQREKIKQFQELSLIDKTRKVDNINAAFTSGNINTMKVDGEELNLPDILNNILNTTNNTWVSAVKQKNWQQTQKNLQRLINELEAIQNTLKINSVVYENALQSLQNLMKINNLNSFSEEELNKKFSELFRLKGDVVEEIGGAWLSEYFPEFSSIVTGALELRNIHNEGADWAPSLRGVSAGQFISDIITLNVSKVELEELEITFRYGANGAAIKTMKLGDFLRYVNQKSGGEKHIAVDDKSYNLLMELSAMNIQAKSGFNQLPWNKDSLNTQISIIEFEDECGINVLMARHIFWLMHSLNFKEETTQWLKQRSSYYDAIANYGLATVMYKVLHLESHSNQFLLTPSGFISYSERMEQLWGDAESWIARIKGGVELSQDVLRKPRVITITGHK